jgi:biopolymer transport protein ExbD
MCAVLLALVGLALAHSHSKQSDIITLDSNGTMRLGTVPLRNTNLRNAALTVVSRLNDGKISFTATGAVTMTNFAEMLGAMHRAGISNVVIRSGSARSDERVKP